MIVTNNSPVVRIFKYRVNGEIKNLRMLGGAVANLPDLTSESQVLYNILGFRINNINDDLLRNIPEPFTFGSGEEVVYDYLFKTLDLGINIPVDLVVRDGARLCWQNNKLHLLGGWNVTVFEPTNDSTNEHWINETPDDPTTWVQLANAPWDGAHAYQLDVVDDVIYKYGNDVQNSGRTAYKYTTSGGWELITADMGEVWGDRYTGIGRYHEGYFYHVGGTTSGIVYHFDILRCTTAFTDWEIVGTLPNTELYLAGCLESINGRLIFWGGGQYLSDSTNTKVYEISDGGSTVTELATLPSEMRGTYTNSAVYDNKIWHSNGYTTTTGNKFGWYYSDDYGVTWTQLYDNSSATHAAALAASSTKLYRLTGNYDNYYYSVEKIVANDNVIPNSASAIYSVRNDSSFVGDYAMEVQRSSDNTTLDIGFVGNDIDEAAMIDFMGVGDLYISKWYDRSGNGNNATNTLGNRPRVGSGGVLDKINGKLAILSIAGETLLFDNSINLATHHTIFAVTQFSQFDKEFIGGAGNVYLVYNASSSSAFNANSGIAVNFASIPLNQQKMLTDLRNDRIYTRYLNSQAHNYSQTVSANNDFVITSIGGEAGYRMIGYVQEIIIYASDKTSYKKGIETNINNYFNVY